MKIQLTTNNQLILSNSGNDSNIIILDVIKKDDTIWLRQKQIEQLFNADQSIISRYIKNAFDEELDEKSISFLTPDNSDKPVAFYNLDVIISVGYKIKSEKSFEFRRWANSIIKTTFLKDSFEFKL